MTALPPHVMDEDDRVAITVAAESIAARLIARDIWRTSWAVTVDGCVFRLKISGYAKAGTARRARQDAKRDALLREAEEYERR